MRRLNGRLTLMEPTEAARVGVRINGGGLIQSRLVPCVAARKIGFVTKQGTTL